MINTMEVDDTNGNPNVQMFDEEMVDDSIINPNLDENPNPGVQNIRALLKKKRKILRGAEKKYAELSSKPRKVAQKSAKEKCIDIIIKKGGTEANPALISKILEEQKVNTTDYEKTIIQQIVASRLDLKSLPISKNLITKPMIYQITSEIKDTNYYTTDYLFWAFIGSATVNDNQLLEAIKLKNISLTSNNALILDEKKEFEEFYIEDFDMIVSCPDWFYDTIIPADSPVETPKSFFINGDEYYCQQVKPTGKNFCTLFRQVNTSVDTAIRIMNNSKKIYSKGILKSGIKKISKTAGAYYIQTSFEPTSFCPATLRFFNDNQHDDPIVFTILLNFEIIPEKLVEIAKTTENFKPAAMVKTYFSKMTVDYLPSIHDFLSVLDLTLGTTNEDWSDIKAFIKLCNENEPCLRAYVKLFKTFEKMVLSFLDSFDIGITIDRLNNVLKNTNEFISEYDFLQQTVCPVFQNKFLELGIELVFCKNFFDTPLKTVASMIKRVCEFILKPTTDVDIKNIAFDVRALGTELLKFLYNGSKPFIGKIRSPASFMGNVYGPYKKEVLSDHVEKVKKEIVKSELKLAEDLNRLKSIKENYVKKVSDVLNYANGEAIYFTDLMQGLKKIVDNPTGDVNTQLARLFTNATQKVEKRLAEEKQQGYLNELIKADETQLFSLPYNKMVQIKNALKNFEFDTLDSAIADQVAAKYNLLLDYIDQLKDSRGKSLSSSTASTRKK